MSKSAKISISLPSDVLTAVETSRRESQESRSDFFRRAAQELLRQESQRAAIDCYVRGYQQFPESEEEEAWAKYGLARLGACEW